MLGQTAAAASLALPWGTVRAGRISFPANRFKNWLFRVPLRTGSSSAWRLNSALPGVRQRRQDVRMNFLRAKAPKQHNFFTGLREKTSGRFGQCPREGRGMRQLRFGPAWTGCGGGLFYPKTYTMKKRQRRILFRKARIFL